MFHFKSFVLGFLACFVLSCIGFSILVAVGVAADKNEKKVETQSNDDVVNLIEKKIDIGLLDDKGNNAYVVNRRIYANKDINPITAKKIIHTLLSLNEQDDARPIDLYLNTSGGYISEAKAIINVMNMIKARVNTYALGYCASSGLRILASGTGTRYAFSNAVLMYHFPDFANDTAAHSYSAVSKKLELNDWKMISKIPDAILSDTNDYYFNPAKALKFSVIDAVLYDSLSCVKKRRMKAELDTPRPKKRRKK